MNAKEIISKLCDNSQSSLSILGVFREIFEEVDEVKLLRKRAILIEYCERILEELNSEDDVKEVFEDIYEVLSYENLKEQINKVSSKLTKAHKGTAISIFSHYKIIQNESLVEEVVVLSDDLKESIKKENLTSTQKQLIYEICEIVEEAREEHKIVGNMALKKLHERLLGKLQLNHHIILKIKNNNIKNKIIDIYNKVQKVNEIMGFIASLENKATKLLDFFS